MNRFAVTYSARESGVSNLSEDEVLSRYRSVYGLGDEIGLDHVRRHIDLEGALTKELLASNPETRWVTFASAYSRLYQELPWLATTGAGGSKADLWRQLLKQKSRILEIGSGAGVLISELAGHGYDCVATDISKGRGAALAGGSKVEWCVSDGINLHNFHPPGTFDYVISDQVVEHLHPDDILAHCRAAYEVLRPGGSYFIRTPHRSIGPSDLSKVIGLDTAVFMHLHEFTYAEFAQVSKRSGFSSLRAVFYAPLLRFVYSSRFFYQYMCAVDWIENEFLGLKGVARGRYRSVARFALVSPTVWVQLVK